MKMMKAAVALGMALTMTVTGASAVFAEGETLSVATDFEIKTLVPWAASEENAFLVLNQAEEGLFRMDENNQPQPALCDTYEVSDDKLTYTFHLRDGIQWSNGEPVTAADFVYAWLKQMSADATNGYSFIMTDYIVNGQEYNEGSVEASEVGVKAVDDQTLEVQLKSPTPYFLNLTTMDMFFPVNEAFCEEQGTNFALSPDSMLYCGPYVITDYDPAVGVTFAKNDNYWDKDNVAIEDAQVRVIKDAAAALSAYQAGELSQVKLDSANVVAYKDDPEFSQEIDFRTSYVQFNLTDDVMSNVNMRKAISLAMNRSALTDNILADGSAPGFGLVADGMSGDGEKTFRELNGDVSPYDPEQAKEYDTYGKKRKFTTVQGIELNLSSGAYGWKTDREEEIKALTEAIQNGETVDKEPAYISKGAQKGSNDIGNSYVEIDLTNQHLYLFKDGDIVLETDFVSGNMSKADCVTPPGVFGLTYKTRNAILRGANYETPVNYWMPFNGNVGMHDATWRRAFGGTIYLTSGSHGCINLPLHMAASIYEYVSTGFPVVCYYY